MQHNTSRPGRMRHAVRWARNRAASVERRHRWRVSWLASAVVVAAALTIAACASSPPGSGGTASAPPRASSSASPGSPLKTTTINGATVLINAKGFTLYSFAPDTPTTSRCNGQCATFWPPVKGPATAGPGVTGTLGTITRSDGAAQATYNGHPLYTYIGDKSPGQAKGNGLNAAGGVWHEVTAVPMAAVHHHHHGGPAHAAASTPPAPPATVPAQPANPIPQGNGGDHDADNNGGPSDGDGNI